MCGRYVLKSAPRRILEQFGVVDGRGETSRSEEWRPRFNLSPSQFAPVVRSDPQGARLDMLRWGLVPPWAHDETFAQRTVNARGETAGRLPAFRAAFKARRCIVPADGFYEWQYVQGSTHKQPWYIHRRDGELLAFAGLWEHWQPRGRAEALHTFTIITTEANAWMTPVHTRMPAILDPAGVKAWLDLATTPEALQALLAPAPEDALDRYPVGRAVGNPRNDSPELLERQDLPEGAALPDPR